MGNILHVVHAYLVLIGVTNSRKHCIRIHKRGYVARFQLVNSYLFGDEGGPEGEGDEMSTQKAKSKIENDDVDRPHPPSIKCEGNPCIP